MKETITRDQVRYMESKLREALETYPDSVNTWLTCFRETVEHAVTMDNMGVDDTELGEKEFDEYVSTIHWMKDHWPLNHSEPETLCMFNKEI